MVRDIQGQNTKMLSEVRDIGVLTKVGNAATCKGVEKKGNVE